MIGNGAGGFNHLNDIHVGVTPTVIAIGDFNGDGKQDFAVANQNSNDVSIRLGDGAGGFTGLNNIGAGGSPVSIAIGDFNGDGKQDLALANQNSKGFNIKPYVEIFAKRSPEELVALKAMFSASANNINLQVLLTSALAKEDDCVKSTFTGLVLGPIEFDLWLLEPQV